MFSFLCALSILAIYSVWVFWPLTPYFTHCWLAIKDEWHSPTLTVQLCVWEAANCPLNVCWGQEKIWYGKETKVICTRKFNCLSLSSKFELQFGFPDKSISHESSSGEVKDRVSLPVSFYFHWVPAQIRCQCLSGFIQKSLYDSDSRAPSESECHNSRKLPPLSPRPDMGSYKQE